MLGFASGFVGMAILLWFSRWLLSEDKKVVKKNPNKLLKHEANKKLSIDWNYNPAVLPADKQENVRNAFYGRAKNEILRAPKRDSWSFNFDAYYPSGITHSNKVQARDYAIEWLSSQFAHDELEIVHVSKSILSNSIVSVTICRKGRSDGKLSLADSRSGGIEQC